MSVLSGVNQRPGLWWGVAAAATVLGAATWLRVPSGWVLAGCAAALAWTAVLTWREARSWFRLGFAAAAAGFFLLAAQTQRFQVRVRDNAEAARSDVERRGSATMAAAIEAESAALQKLARLALDAPRDTVGAFAHLNRIRGGVPERAVVIVRSGFPFAWSGRFMAPIELLTGTVGAVDAPFYLAINAVAARGDDRAIAQSLVHVDRPADALATALDAKYALAAGLEGFVYNGPAAAPSDSFAVARAAGTPLLGVRAVAPPSTVLAARALERGQTRSGLLFAIALALYLAGTWRNVRSIVPRLAVLAVALTTVAIVPLPAFSNASRLFDPAFFHVPEGGPFASCVGALAITSGIVLLALLALLRARLTIQSRVQALLVLIVIVGMGPFVLRDLARGIQFPAQGATAVLWLAWEGTIFLAAVTVLIAGLAAGRAALGPRRGLPLWIAVCTAVIASLLAPVLLDAPGGFPAFYPLLWAAAIAACALGRRDRALVVTALIAACGAVTLVWGQTVRARVLLAESDVSGLSKIDPDAANLLGRFTAQLDSAHAPASRVELLARYAQSDLASSDYPVELLSWDSHGRPMGEFNVAMSQAHEPPRAIETFAAEVAGGTKSVLRAVPAVPGIHLVLSVPHADGSVTTAVVAPRTRLLPRDAFGALSGLAGEPAADPPYSLRPSQAAPGSIISEKAQWVRRGNELHGDWFLPSVSGQVQRIHATVELRDYEALATRGLLVVLFDLAVVAMLWLLLVLADGAFGRWVRMRRRGWMSSYRAQLTVSLFAFFVLPAGAFAVWSYSRLQNDDQQSRDLLIRETLRGVMLANDSASLAQLSDRFETPLFVYANGFLVRTSDPVLDVLVPTGRLLPPAAAVVIRDGDDVTTSNEEFVGAVPMRFGYRTTVIDTTGVQYVLAAPARPNDLVLDQRRRDLGIFVLFAVAVGGLAALWLSGLAARQFSRPIGALQRGALALAAGEREPRLDSDPPTEFQPVFRAFRQMARDLETGREHEARAQRVLAWGEMARQVAHEIKNPLTPMRLGMQHLRRARNDPRVNFDVVLNENIERVLSEIDRLDEIARAFSRYGTAPDDRPTAEPVNVARVAVDVTGLEQLGAGDIAWTAEVADTPSWALARDNELREVLLNVLENSRSALARHVTVLVGEVGGMVEILVRDDGTGILPDVLPRIFEPHFSTRTSGSGLGLAISRRMIEGWGGTIAVETEIEVGTVIRIRLVPAPAR
jgi:signal transduction histidine kinase